MQNKTTQRHAIATLVQDARSTQKATARTEEYAHAIGASLDLAMSALSMKETNSAQTHIAKAKQHLSIVLYDIKKDAKSNAESVKNLETIFAAL
jgi:Tfp pilus assembly protein PilF